jgi:hypothetical protein
MNSRMVIAVWFDQLLKSGPGLEKLCKILSSIKAAKIGFI